jgi:hypothetical protein
MKKKGTKSKAAKMRDLPQKAVNAKTARGVKGGGAALRKSVKQDDGPEESITFVYGGLGVKYTP